MSDPAFWLAAGMTGAVVAALLAIAWWLFRSRVTADAGEPVRLGRRASAVLAVALAAASILWIFGAFWDSSQHLRTGIVPGGEDFLWPPHLVLYSGFAISVGAAGLATLLLARQGLARGQRDVRLWVRANPWLGAIALTAAYALAAVPVDAVWHAWFGIDLTVWSPPHVLLIVAASAQLVGAVGLLAQAWPRSERGAGWDVAVAVLLGLMLNELMLLSLEYELVRDRLLDPAVLNDRPAFAYPLVVAAVSILALVASRTMTRIPFAATITALTFHVTRWTMSVAVEGLGHDAPAAPLPVLVGALLLDAPAWAGLARRIGRAAAEGLAFSVGFLPLAMPWIIARSVAPVDAWAVMTMVVLVDAAAVLCAWVTLRTADVLGLAAEAPDTSAWVTGPRERNVELVHY